MDIKKLLQWLYKYFKIYRVESQALNLRFFPNEQLFISFCTKYKFAEFLMLVMHDGCILEFILLMMIVLWWETIDQHLTDILLIFN
jgi:hypothetical protein